MHSLTGVGLSIDGAEQGDPNRRSPVSLSGLGGLSTMPTLRLKREKCNET